MCVCVCERERVNDAERGEQYFVMIAISSFVGEGVESHEQEGLAVHLQRS